MKTKLFLSALAAALILVGCQSATDSKDTAPDISTAPADVQENYEAVATASMEVMSVGMSKVSSAEIDYSADGSKITYTYAKDEDGIAMSGKASGSQTKMTQEFTVTATAYSLGESTFTGSVHFTVVLNIVDGEPVMQSLNLSATGTLTTGEVALPFELSVKSTGTKATGTVKINGTSYSFTETETADSALGSRLSRAFSVR